MIVFSSLFFQSSLSFVLLNAKVLSISKWNAISMPWRAITYAATRFAKCSPNEYKTNIQTKPTKKKEKSIAPCTSVFDGSMGAIWGDAYVDDDIIQQCVHENG